MNLAFVYVTAGSVDSALTTAALVGGSFSPEAPLAYVAWAVAKAGDVARALEIVKGLRRDASREMALGDIAVTQAESGDLGGATTTADMLPSDAERAVALADIALVQFQAGDRASASAILRRANSLVRSAASKPQRNYALQVVAAVYGKSRDFSGALAVATLGETNDLRKTIRWDLAMAHAEAGDVPGALRVDGSIKRTGHLAASLAEGGHLDAAREALGGIWDNEDRVEASRHVAVVFAKRQARVESAKLFADARQITAKLRDPFWRACRSRKVAVSQAEAAFDAEALDTAGMIGSISERRRALREIARAQALDGRFVLAVTWAMDQSDPLMRGVALLGAAEGALDAAGLSDVQKIKVNRYQRRSSVSLFVAC